MNMNILREKIKTIIFNYGGLPGLNPTEYQTEMRKILLNELSDSEKAVLRASNVHLDYLILELSREIVEETL